MKLKLILWCSKIFRVEDVYNDDLRFEGSVTVKFGVIDVNSPLNPDNDFMTSVSLTFLAFFKIKNLVGRGKNHVTRRFHLISDLNVKSWSRRPVNVCSLLP